MKYNLCILSRATRTGSSPDFLDRNLTEFEYQKNKVVQDLIFNTFLLLYNVIVIKSAFSIHWFVKHLPPQVGRDYQGQLDGVHVQQLHQAARDHPGPSPHLRCDQVCLLQPLVCQHLPPQVGWDNQGQLAGNKIIQHLLHLYDYDVIKI